MSELNQELELPNNNNNNNPEDIQEASAAFPLLRLDSFNSSSSTNPNTTINHHQHHHIPCTACGCPGSSAPCHLPTTTTTIHANSFSCNKRRTPDPTTATTMDDQLPKKPKKLFLGPQETTTTTTTNNTVTSPTLHGFSMISLPLATSSGTGNPIHFNTQTRSTDSFPVLRRCTSDPCNPQAAVAVSGPDSLSGSGTGNIAVQQSSPESAKMMMNGANATPVKGSASLPPRPPTALRRTVSDPSPNNSFSRSSSSNDMGMDESPSYKKLRMMKDYFKQMNQLLDEFVSDDMMCKDEEEEYKSSEDNATDAAMGDLVTDFEEAVSVERTGECLVIHFRCPCGKGYQILLNGSYCYYKLM